MPSINESLKDSKYLPDFHALFNRGGNGIAYLDSLSPFVQVTESSLTTSTATNSTNGTWAQVKKVAPVLKKGEKHFTPKEVYELKWLHNKGFKLNVDPAYLESQLSDFKTKLGLIKSEEYDMRNGVSEIASMVIRLENRKQYAKFREFYEQYPYTMGSRIDSILKSKSYLQLGKIAEFLADMPKEATEAMKEYTKNTDKLCGKQAIFYIIADKKDFQKTEKRRDPILLAQSPFGHFWQILGAWDSEMLLLENL